ncbi:MAG: hypothetical protein Tsb0020_11610 [Haliangiales bacterium]
MEPNSKRISELLEQNRAALAALDDSILIRPNVHRARVVALTNTTLQSFARIEPSLDEELSPARAIERRQQAEQLESRALTYFAADLDREENATKQESRRAEIAARVTEHDRYLSKWAWPLFGDDPELNAVLVDIRAGRGVQDDAEDVVRLAQLYRSRWQQAAGKTPVTMDYLSTAEAEATELITLLDEGVDAARDVAWRAFAYWRQAYQDLMNLGRYLTNNNEGSESQFPGISSARRSQQRTPSAPPSELPGDVPSADAPDSPDSPAQEQPVTDSDDEPIIAEPPLAAAGEAAAMVGLVASPLSGPSATSSPVSADTQAEPAPATAPATLR